MNITGVGSYKPVKKTKKKYDIKIAAFRRGGLGDGFLQSIMMAAIKKHFNSTYLTAYTDTSFTSILQGASYCDAIMPVEWRRGFITEVEVRNRYKNGYNLWFDLKPLQFVEGDGIISDSLRSKLSDIESRYYSFNGHELVNFYREMGVRGQIGMFSKLFNIPVDASDTYLPEEQHNLKLPDKYATISAGWTDTSFYKAWEQPKWEIIVEKLNKCGICPVQLGKSDEPFIRGSISATNLSLNQQYTVLKNSTLYLGSDGFFTHVATKYDIPSIVLWGVTPWEVWGHSNQYDVISPKFDCLWWTHWHWAHDSRCGEIMNAITPEMVEEKIEMILK